MPGQKSAEWLSPDGWLRIVTAGFVNTKMKFAVDESGDPLSRNVRELSKWLITDVSAVEANT